MRGYISLIIISIAYLVVESTLVTSLPMPDILLLLVFYTAVTRPNISGVIFCFLLGYIEDIFLGGVLGSTSFSYMAVFLAVYFLSHKVHFRSPGVSAITALALTSVKVFLIYLIMRSINSEIGLSYLTLADIVLTSFFAPFVMNLLGRVDTMVSPHAIER